MAWLGMRVTAVPSPFTPNKLRRGRYELSEVFDDLY